MLISRPCVGDRHCLHHFESDPSDPATVEGQDAQVFNVLTPVTPAFCCRESCRDVFLVAREFEEKSHGIGSPPRLRVRR